MNNKETENILASDAELTETALHEIFSDSESGITSVLFDAERYSLFCGGKRIRPALAIEVCRAFGGNIGNAIHFACAVEMIHTYSLIHDDLPCMDNADMRRGKASNHKVYGETFALLAGDGLLTDAFGVAADNKNIPAEQTVSALKLLSRAAGSHGMVGGQVADIYGETHELTHEQLVALQRGKTGAMIRVSALLGALAAGVGEDDPRFAKVAEYAEKIGLAFQIKDDILDRTADTETMGKITGRDTEIGKTTFLSFYSIEEASEKVKELTDSACKAISDACGDNAKILSALALWLSARTH